MDASGTPKFDLKMIALPVMLILYRQVDLKNPTTIEFMQQLFAGVLIGIMTVLFVIYMRIAMNPKAGVQIWVPPPATPTLSFIPQETVDPKRFVCTTYVEHG